MSAPKNLEMNVAHHYLVAMPNLTDPQFGGTVIYVAEHNTKGAMGLIVNRPSDMTLATLFDRIDLSPPMPSDIAVKSGRHSYGPIGMNPFSWAGRYRPTVGLYCTNRWANGAPRWC